MPRKRSRKQFLISDIAPYVLGVLRQQKFFALLEDDFWPLHSKAPQPCGHTFRRTERILQRLGMDAADTEEVELVLMSQGACCDCEVLYNVAEESRMKAAYWKARVAEDFGGNKG